MMWGRQPGLVQEQIDALDHRNSMARIEIHLARLEERIGALADLANQRYVNLETMVRYQAEKVALALDASQLAIDKQDMADEKARDRLAEDLKHRFDAANEFRGQQRDIVANTISRVEFDQYRQTMSDQIAQLRIQYNKEIGELKGRLDKSEGKSLGSAGTWAAVVGSVTLIVIIINVVIYAIGNSGG